MSFFELPDQVLGRWWVLCEPGLDVAVDILGIAQFGEGADPGVLRCAQTRGRAVPRLGPRRHHQAPSRRTRQGIEQRPGAVNRDAFVQGVRHRQHPRPGA